MPWINRDFFLAIVNYYYFFSAYTRANLKLKLFFTSINFQGYWRLFFLLLSNSITLLQRGSQKSNFWKEKNTPFFFSSDFDYFYLVPSSCFSSLHADICFNEFSKGKISVKPRYLAAQISNQKIVKILHLSQMISCRRDFVAWF